MYVKIKSAPTVEKNAKYFRTHNKRVGLHAMADGDEEDVSPSKQYAAFSLDSYHERFEGYRQAKKKCRCSKNCLYTYDTKAFDVHARLVDFIYTISPPELRARILRTFVMTCYMQCVNEKGNHEHYRLPAFKKLMCRDAFCEFMNISVTTYQNWRRATEPNRDVLPDEHALVDRKGDQANASKPEARKAAAEYIKFVAEREGHPLPVRIRASDKRLMEKIEGTEQMLVLPPRFTRRSLHSAYLQYQADQSLHLSLPAFTYTLTDDVPWVRISLRARGLCDTCMSFRESLRMVSDSKVKERGLQWKVHLQDAEDSVQIYRDAKAQARLAWQRHKNRDDDDDDDDDDNDERLVYGMVSFDASAQFNLPMVEEQTHNEFHAEKQGIDVRVLGINNQGAAEGGHQHNYLFIEPLHHDANGTISALHHYLSTTQKSLGNAKTLVVQCDSTTGSNKNQYMLAYLCWRVFNDFHDAIVWQFMTVGHTKFDVDRLFAVLRQHLGLRSSVFTPNEFAVACDEAGETSSGVVMDRNDMLDFSSLSKVYTREFPDMVKRFPYEIKVYKTGDKVYVAVKREPCGEPEPPMDFVLKPMPDTLDSLPVIGGELGDDRLNHLANNTFRITARAHALTDEQKEYWHQLLGEHWRNGKPMKPQAWKKLKWAREIDIGRDAGLNDVEAKPTQYAYGDDDDDGGGGDGIDNDENRKYWPPVVECSTPELQAAYNDKHHPKKKVA